MQRTTQYYHPKDATSQKSKDRNVAGFYQGGEGGEDEDGDMEHIDDDPENFHSVYYWREPLPVVDLDLLGDLCLGEVEAHGELHEEDGDDFGYDSDKENVDSDEGCADDDDDSWITPSNIKDKKKQFNGDFRGDQESKVNSRE